MATLVQDCRYAVRALAKAPGLTLIVLLTVGIGTGANATVFSFMNAVLFRPAAGVRGPGALVSIFTSDYSSTPFGDSSYPDYLSLKAEAPAFESMAAAQDDAVAVLRLADVVERIRVMRVSGEYFELLGLHAAAGRLLSRADVNAAESPTAVISHRLWRRAFGADGAVVGMVINVAGHAHTIVGVAPEQFEGLDLGRAFDVWTPLQPPPEGPEERGNRGLSVIARLRPGVALAEAQAQVQAIAERLAHAYPRTNLGTLKAPALPRPMYVLPHTRIPPQFRGDVIMLTGVIMAAVTVVLLIACANVAGLLVARATARSREMAIRVALGAGRIRLLRQLITESLILGAAGGCVGLLVALWTADVLPSFFPADQARMLDTSIDGRVLVFTGLVSVVSSLLFGTFPALHGTRRDRVSALRGDVGRISDGRAGTQLRRALVVAQVALAVVLMVSASLLARSLSNALRADLGLGTREAVLASVELPLTDFSAARGAVFYTTAVERLRALPGVEAASLVRTLPLAGGPRRGFRAEGYQPQPGEETELYFNVVGVGYFETMQIAVRAGRTFDGRDRADSEPVAVVDETFARRYFASAAVGRFVTDSSGRRMRIVGVVRPVTQLTVQDSPLPQVYYPLSQSYSPRMTIVARTQRNAEAHTDDIRRALRDLNPGVAVFRSMTLAEHVDEALTGERLTATLVGVCAAMALALAVIGIYGVIAYGVVRRTREIGLRVALGASRLQVVRLIAAEGMILTLGGIIVGAMATAGASRLLASMLYGVRPTDLWTYATVPCVFAVAAAAAASIPARRALAVNPITALREE